MFTPEEFEELHKKVRSGNEAYLNQVKIMDPLQGVKAGHRRVLEMLGKLEDLEVKILNYQRGGPIIKLNLNVKRW